jgi:hypothetical protein
MAFLACIGNLEKLKLNGGLILSSNLLYATSFLPQKLCLAKKLKSVISELKVIKFLFKGF